MRGQAKPEPSVRVSVSEIDVQPHSCVMSEDGPATADALDAPPHPRCRHKFAIVRHPFGSRRDGRFRRIPPSLGRIGKQPNEHVLH
jgi:hypothetical protein